jgi:thiamine kinase-like enzyme
VNKINQVLKTQFNIDCIDITEIHGGLSAANYKIETGYKPFFLKVYDKRKAQSSLWTENIEYYMPILMWLNENTKLQGRIARPLRTINGDYRFDDEDNTFILFDYVAGETVGKFMSHNQLSEIANILACLHSYGDEIPFDTTRIKENFSVPFCFSIKHFIAENLSKSPVDVKAILQPCLELLISKNNEVKALSEMIKKKNIKMVLCHTDAHGWNLIQDKQLVLIDWEGLRLAPAEADLCMFTKKEYWDTFLEHYVNCRPNFKLDENILLFYVLRRKIEDIWAFLESILYDNLSDGQRVRDLNLLASCCYKLNDCCFEL